jgi:uracil-DNA glycosylase
MQISSSQLSNRKFITMTKAKSKDAAKEFFPERKSLSAVRKAAADCQACDLWERATQTVFGEGPRRAEVLFVGEQPGNEEDLTGEPFVGPAGKLLDRALEKAGIDRQKTYVTNVVKHFKWEPRGKRRIHKRPNAKETAACRPWLESEIARQTESNCLSRRHCVTSPSRITIQGQSRAG